MGCRAIAVTVTVLLAMALALPLLPAHAAVTVSRAEVNGDELRLEGTALPGADITVDGVVRGSADNEGAFRIEFSPFSSDTCEVSVDDGDGPVTVTPDGCVPAEEEPPPEEDAGGPDAPTFALRTEHVMVGKEARFGGRTVTDPGGSVAFVFDWGDGATTRVPAEGFFTADATTGSVSSGDVAHVYAAAGTVSVTITASDPDGNSATSDPASLTVHPDDHVDCGVSGDAGDTHGESRAVALPVDCTGRLEGSTGIDRFDTYHFDVTEPFRLLTVRTSPPVAFELFRPDPADCTGGPCPEPIPAAEIVNGGVGWTLDEAGTWTIRLGSFGLAEDVDYRLRLHAGGGGDDCVSGRNPALPLPAPVDAMNNAGSLVLLQNGEVDCAGSLPLADLDRQDTYVFRVERDELAAMKVLPSTPGEVCDAAIEVLVQRPEHQVPRTECSALLFQARDPGSVFFGLRAGSPWDGDLGYRLHVATTSVHDGDCFTHADAGDSFDTANPITSVCLGDVDTADPDDWYRVAVGDGDELVVFGRGGVPLEVYDPDGARQATSGGAFQAVGKPGEWRIRAHTDPGGADFQGTYGLSVLIRKGAPGGDCGSGGDTPAAGLAVTLPVDCTGAFLPHGDDTIDRYSFELTEGETIEVTVSAGGRGSRYEAAIEPPSCCGAVADVDFQQEPTTFSVTATETGTWDLVVDWFAADPFDTTYDFSITRQETPTAPDLSARLLDVPTSVARGQVFHVEGRVRAEGAPAEDVRFTLSSSPDDAVRLEESNFDSFGDDEEPTFTVNLGNIPAPGEEAFTWALRADREGPTTLTVTAVDATGTTATASKELTITD